MLGMLVAGTANTVLIKISYETKGLNGHKFTHPFFQTFLMFMGEAACLIIYGAKTLY